MEKYLPLQEGNMADIKYLNPKLLNKLISLFQRKYLKMNFIKLY